ncbi:MAG: hypothetical protein AB8B50_03755 [Pirellulaceae bacterium]
MGSSSTFIDLDFLARKARQSAVGLDAAKVYLILYCRALMVNSERVIVVLLLYF